MAQRDQRRLGSAGTLVSSLAQHSRSRIQCCPSCGLGHNYGSDMIPGLEISCALGWPKKEKKRKEIKMKVPKTIEYNLWELLI